MYSYRNECHSRGPKKRTRKKDISESRMESLELLDLRISNGTQQNFVDGESERRPRGVKSDR